MIKIKKQKGFIQIPILAWVIISIIGAGSVGYGVNEYSNVSKSISRAENLAKEEKYNEAVQELESTKNSWLSNNLGIKKQEIAGKIEKNKKLLDDKSKYDQGVQEFEKQNYSQAKELFSKVSDNSSRYLEAKNKIEEAQNKITEKQVAEAVEKVKEESAKEAESLATPTPTPKPTSTPKIVVKPTPKIEPKTITPTPTPVLTSIPTPIPVDWCNNIEGAQLTIPIGMVRNGNDNTCAVPTPTPTLKPTPTPAPTPDPKIAKATIATEQLLIVANEAKNELDVLYAEMQVAHTSGCFAPNSGCTDAGAAPQIAAYNRLVSAYNIKLENYKKILSMQYVIDDYKNGIYVSVGNRSFLGSLGINL